MTSSQLLMLAVGIVALSASAFTHAQVMQSATYQIQSDSINFGGARGSSTSYALEDTLGEIATGDSESASYTLRAGYQQMHEVYLALTGGANVALSPTLSTTGGGTASGSTTLTALTDGRAGYRMSVRASASPAMQSASNSIANYTPAGANPDFAFSVAVADAEFAYTPQGSDVAARFRDDGASCNTGSSEATLSCWDALTTTDVTVAERTSANHPAGTDTVLEFRVGAGASATIPVGTYVATTTVTLIAL